MRLAKDQFKRLEAFPFIQIGTGFVVQDAHANKGLITVNFEGGGIVKHYFLGYYDSILHAYAPRKVSVFLKGGWGPLLVAPETVPNFAYITPGLTVNQFRSNVSYGVVMAINTSGEGPDYLYGVTASLDQLELPFFITGLKGKDMDYLFFAGVRVSLLDLFGLRRYR